MPLPPVPTRHRRDCGVKPNVHSRLPIVHAAGAVASSQGDVRIGQVVDELANQRELSQEDRSDLLPSGKQTVFSNRVPWAKSYLSKAQLVEMTGRGYFRITPRGQAALRSSPKRVVSPFNSRLTQSAPVIACFRNSNKDDGRRRHLDCSGRIGNPVEFWQSIISSEFEQHVVQPNLVTLERLRR